MIDLHGSGYLPPWPQRNLDAEVRLEIRCSGRLQRAVALQQEGVAGYVNKIDVNIRSRDFGCVLDAVGGVCKGDNG